jgi:hypothetical protein
MSLLNNLISYWKLDEASGNAVDAHGSNTLTAVNAPGSTSGKIGNARTFNGSNQYFSIADNASLSTGDIDFSISYWVWFNNFANIQDVVAKDNQAAGGREYLTGFNTVDSRLRFVVFNSGGSATSVSATSFGALTSGVWFFVVCWHDAVNNVLGISVNGTSDTVSYSGGVLDGNSSFAIGARPAATPAVHTNGRIDEVGFWKRVLTSGERSDLYNSGNGLSYDSFASVQQSRRRRELSGGGL